MAINNPSFSNGASNGVADAPAPQPVHPTAARRPQDTIVVQSANTTYTDEFITSSFVNRGADVVVQREGRFIVQPTSTAYELQTARKVPKTGCELSRPREGAH
jgi:myo-inositol-1-phosphate synthase